MALGTRLLPTSLCGVALVTLSACSDSTDAQKPSDVSAEVSADISTVVEVRWHTDEASIGYVEYGPSREFGMNTPLEDAETKDHSYNLLGLSAETQYYYRVVTWDGRDAAASDVATITTGSLPLGIPHLNRQGDGNDLYTIVPVLGTNKAVTILNPNGDVVWYHTDEGKLDCYRARLSLDGKDVLYNSASVSGNPANDSKLVRVALDGSKSSAIEIPLLAHDFVEHPDGTLAAMVVEYRDFQGKQLRGDKIVEVDTAGNQTTIWTSWDCFDPAVVPGDDIENGWTFANALDYDPSEQKYYLGLRNFSSIVKIDRATHACEWVFGTMAATIDFAPGSDQFLHQHQFHLRGNHIVVFDNDGSLGDESRVLEYELDFETNLATQVWSYASNPTVHTFVLGEPTRLANGDTFIDWGTAGQLERVNKTGESIWKVNSSAGVVFGFNTLAPSLYSTTAKNP